MGRLPLKAQALTVAVILSNLAGNTLISAGTRGRSGLEAFANPVVLAGVALLVIWTIIRATLMSWADLSYILPVTAAGYILTAVVGTVFLHEHVPPARWAATLLIVAGIVLAGTTRPRTTPNATRKTTAEHAG